jgi:acetyl-CoA carboxylase biotin carboxyl carrier protein
VEVRAQLSASVWQVKVEAGQQVAVGDTLVILESMKMEIPVEAERAGVVREVLVKPDDLVQQGDPLVTLETTASS